MSRKRIIELSINWESLSTLVKKAPAVSGIYFLGAPYPIAYEHGVSHILYIGSSTNLQGRLQSHIRDRERGVFLIRTMLAQDETVWGACCPLEGFDEDTLCGIEYATLYVFGLAYGMVPHGNSLPPESSQGDRWLDCVRLQEPNPAGNPLTVEMIAERYGLQFDLGHYGPTSITLSIDTGGEDLNFRMGHDGFKSVSFRPKIYTIKKSEPPIVEKKERDYLFLESLDFFGSVVQSANGRYIAATDDSIYVEDEGLEEIIIERPGLLVLLEDNELLFHKQLERPNEVAVANNGMIVVNDWTFNINPLGIFYVIDRTGNILIKHEIQANLDRCGISEDGNIAWCSSLVSNSVSESEKIFIYFVPEAKLIFKLDNSQKRSLKYLAFLDNEIHLGRGIVIEKYNLQGKLLNKEEVESAYFQDFVNHGNPYDFFYRAQNIYKGKGPQKLSESEVQEVKFFLTKALKHQKFESSYCKARAYRMLGELAEFLKDYQTTLDNYRKALSYDPKVGLQKALIKIEKIIQG